MSGNTNDKKTSVSDNVHVHGPDCDHDHAHAGEHHAENDHDHHQQHEHVHGPNCSHAAQSPFVRTDVKLGRNDPCSCGSGAKFKKCCGKS